MRSEITYRYLTAGNPAAKWPVPLEILAVEFFSKAVELLTCADLLHAGCSKHDHPLDLRGRLM